MYECYYVYIVESLLQSPLLVPFIGKDRCIEFLAELFISSIEQEINITIILHEKLIGLSLLSTTIGTEHEPLLQLGMVNLWQL